MRHFESSGWLRWCLFLCLAVMAHVALSATDYELESRIGATGSPMQSALVLSHNSPEAVTAEVNDPAIRRALAQAAGVKDFQKILDIQLSVTSPRWPESSNLN